ncbi:anti-anti-sigma factor [Amycolatopsis coloradensis]|uniref:Anti-sigma factor antagonist n=1 Tax=Amycolatopsis coloradensis TaxID=76021 RepID=A0A1R0KS71_9PSEU|nr:STAS domain-containing protein [Amycolatopsis coloradensis]OLZ50700.1 anti-anti-sigma factor [Amycolatopsis coloradensis]
MAFNTGIGHPAPLAVIEAERSHDAVTVEVAGDVDISTSPRLLTETRALLAGRTGVAVIDMTGVGFCDSSGLSVLLQLSRSCAESGIELKVVPSKVVYRAIELTGLLSTLRVAE